MAKSEDKSFDDSVIMLDDSPDIVEIVEEDVEEGEVEDFADMVDSNDNKTTCTTETADSAEAKEDPVFEIKFSDMNNYDLLNDRLVNVLQVVFAEDSLDFKTISSTDGTVPRLCAYKVPKQAEQESLPDDIFFQIDTHPAVKLNAAQVPSYKRTNSDVLDEYSPMRKKLKAEEENKCQRPKIQSACFNCGGTDHSLRECTKPRNNARIQRSRKKVGNRQERYHTDSEQRFAHIKPGQMSGKTRHAMGYNRGELPFMYYRLRVLGYPPAWLEQAKVQSSGMSLFNADGSEVLKSDEEDGEDDNFKYDVDKIIDYPGFNVHPGPKFFDDYKHHNVPKFQERDLKENFIKSLGENVIKGYKRKKLKDLPAINNGDSKISTEPSNVEQHDMEVEDCAEAPSCEQPPGTEESQESPPASPAQRAISPSLEDLQAQQAQLLEQLDTSSTLDESNISLDNSKVQSDLQLSSTATTTPIAAVSKTSIKTSIEGTPLLKFSIYDKLPQGDNFKVGVSDVINFENLPDSTGKYEQMKDVLKNVRKALVKLQNE